MSNAALKLQIESPPPVSWQRLVSAPVSEISNYEELLQFKAPWEELARESVEPNVFFESSMLLPAFRLYATKRDKVLLVWSLDQCGAPLLIGLLPVSERNLYRKLPLFHLATWEYAHCYLGSPLIRRGFERSFFEKLSRYLETRSATTFLELRMIRQDGAIARALTHYSGETEQLAIETSKQERALLCSSLSAAIYLENSLSKKKRKEFDRLQRRLAELGEVEVQVAAKADQIEGWIEEFLNLELTGWKGKSGSALALSKLDREFFEEVVKSAFEKGNLMMLKLSLNGKAIAMQCNLISAEGSFSFKICFDEAFSRFSPGVLLEIDNLKTVLSDPKVRWMDSCAEPGHSMIDRLWNERRVVGNTLFSSRSHFSRLLVQSVGLLHKIKTPTLTVRQVEKHELSTI